jgi:sialic acid synthase SpsE
MSILHIGDRAIGPGRPPYLIAEIGSNHSGDLETAFKLIDVAANSGAHAAKFQLFFAEELYPEGHDLHAVFKQAELNVDWLPKLKEYTERAGLHFFASVFGRKSAKVMLDLGVPAFKVASSETTNHGLLAYLAATGLPLLISTGMCDMIDIAEAVAICQRAKNDRVALLQCGAEYPLPGNLVNMNVLDTLRQRFPYLVGYSDHTEGSLAAFAAVAKGACIIEKHITLDRSAKGPDHFYAMEPDDFARMIDGINQIHAMLGDGEKDLLPSERQYGRRDGLYARTALKSGVPIKAEDIEAKRPALGIRGRYKDAVCGSVPKKDIAAGAPITWHDIENGAA